MPATLEQHKATNKHQWKKRWILLQDNFLFCYKADQTNEPVLLFRLGNHKIVPISEREVGKKFCFLLTCGKKSYYFAAANPQVLLKWLNVLSHEEIVHWYLSEDIDSDEETNTPTGTITKSDSTLSLTESDPSADIQPVSKQSSLKRAISRMRSIDHSGSPIALEPFPGIRFHHADEIVAPGSPATQSNPPPVTPKRPVVERFVDIQTTSNFISQALN
jgi:hypothetical protein